MVRRSGRHDYRHGDLGGRKQSTRWIGTVVGRDRRRPSDRRLDQQGCRTCGRGDTVGAGADLVLLPSPRDVWSPCQGKKRRLPEQRNRSPDGLPHPPASLAENENAGPSTSSTGILLRSLLRREGSSRHPGGSRQFPLRDRGLHPRHDSRLIFHQGLCPAPVQRDGICRDHAPASRTDQRAVDVTPVICAPAYLTVKSEASVFRVVVPSWAVARTAMCHRPRGDDSASEAVTSAV